MATLRLVPNLDKLLSLVAEPSNLCLVLVISCVFCLVSHRWIMKATGLFRDEFQTDSDPVGWMDEATSSFFTTLQVSLTLSGLELVRFLCFRHWARVVHHVLTTATIGRLMLTLVALFLSVVVIGLGFKAIFFTASLFGQRMNTDGFVLDFPEYDRGGNEFLCPFYDLNMEDNIERRRANYPLSMYLQTEHILLRLNQHGLLEHAKNSAVEGSGVHWRYPSEDVALPCQLMVQLTFHRLDHVHFNVRWTKDDVAVNTTRGQRVSVRSAIDQVSWASPENEAPDTQWVVLTDMLLIRHLQEEDFGYYHCHVFVTPEPPSSLQPSVLEARFKSFSVKVATKTLVKFTETMSVLSEHPGDQVKVRTSYIMLSDSNDDVFFEHRVNGVPRGELPEEDKCSYELCWPFWDFSYYHDNRLERTVDVDGYTFVCQLHIFCVEQYHYGEHTFILRREFYNADSRTEDFVETTYGSVLVIPEAPKLFSDARNNAYFSYLRATDCWDNNMTVLTESCSQTLALMKAWSRFHYLLDCWVSMLIFILLHTYYVWWACTLIRYVLSLTLPELYRPSFAKMAPQAPSPHTQSPSAKRRSVFLAYADGDVELSVHVKSVLETYDLHVFDSQQHVAPGQPPLSAWDRAMDRCSGFVVLVSADYLLQPDLSLQFQSIHHLLLEHEVRESDVVLVVAGGCHIPPALGPLPTIDLHHQHWQRDLEWWAFCFRGQFPNTAVVDQVGRDLRRDTHSLLAYNRRDDEVRQVLPHLSFVFRRLEAVCKPEGPHSADHDRKEGESHAAIRGSLQSGTAANRASAMQSPCTTAEPVCSSDSGEEDLVQASMESSPDSTQSQCVGSGELPHLGDEVFVSADRGTEGAAPEVFLTYCEESSWDCTVAGELKAALEGCSSSSHVLFPNGRGLRVYDAVQDLLPGRPDVHLVSAAARSSAFVVLLSPAYVQDPITRRLHFPQVLQAVFRDAVETESVLIVHTSGSVPLRHVHNDADADDNDDHDVDDEAVSDADNEDAGRRVPHLDADCTDYEVWEAGGGLEGALRLPRWFQAFTHLHWSPCLGLCEKERLELWASHVASGITDGDDGGSGRCGGGSGDDHDCGGGGDYHDGDIVKSTTTTTTKM